MINTERLVIKPLTAEDEKAISKLFTDNIVKKTYILPDFKDPEHLSRYFMRILEISNSKEHYLYGVYLKDSMELVGMINDTEIDGNESIELGYAYLPEHFGKGYATEALGGMINYLKGLGFRRVNAGAFEENPASMRVMEKCGMTRTGMTGSLQYRGVEHKVIYYSV